MAPNLISDLIDTYWAAAESTLADLGAEDLVVLNTAVGALDRVWDNHIFEHAETFGGTEIGFARSLSSLILKRMLGAEYAALVSVAGSEVASTGDAEFDNALERAAAEALNTFADELLGPVAVGHWSVSAKPLQVDSPVPIGAVVLATAEPLSDRQLHLLESFLEHLDTRLGLAEKLLSLRCRSLDAEYEVKKLKGELSVPEVTKKSNWQALPKDLVESMSALAEAVPKLELFGVTLPTDKYEFFCRNLEQLTATYLELFDAADHLFIDVPSGVDAKDHDSKPAQPYHRLLQVLNSLKPALRLLYHVTAEDLAPRVVVGQVPTFADLTRVAKTRSEDEGIRIMLEIMDDQAEQAEADALTARRSPYEFRAANIGEVFALLALHETVRQEQPEAFERANRSIHKALRGYQAARAYLLSFDRFEDVPLRGADRTQPPDAEKLLLLREGAPGFGVLLSAWSK
jgi:hypothetical protein